MTVDPNKNYKARVHITPEAWNAAQIFVLERWKERAAERPLPEPYDLSNSCKFSSLFVQRVFGGHLCGNEQHVFNNVDGEIIDLNEHAEDVRMMDNPYMIDLDCLDDEDYLVSLESCLPRVNQWVKEFIVLARAHHWLIANDPSNTHPFNL